MCVTVLVSLLAEVASNVAVDNWFDDAYSLQIDWHSVKYTQKVWGKTLLLGRAKLCATLHGSKSDGIGST